MFECRTNNHLEAHKKKTSQIATLQATLHIRRGAMFERSQHTIHTTWLMALLKSVMMAVQYSYMRVPG